MEILIAIRTLRQIAKSHGLKLKQRTNSLGVFFRLTNTDKTLESGHTYIMPTQKELDFFQQLDNFRNDPRTEEMKKIIKTERGYYFKFDIKRIF